MSNKTVVTTCDDCGANMVVINEAMGNLCIIALCTICADGPITTHDQKAMDDTRGYPAESIVVGVRVSKIEL